MHQLMTTTDIYVCIHIYICICIHIALFMAINRDIPHMALQNLSHLYLHSLLLNTNQLKLENKKL